MSKSLLPKSIQEEPSPLRSALFIKSEIYLVVLLTTTSSKSALTSLKVYHHQNSRPARPPLPHMLQPDHPWLRCKLLENLWWWKTLGLAVSAPSTVKARLPYCKTLIWIVTSFIGLGPRSHPPLGLSLTFHHLKTNLKGNGSILTNLKSIYMTIFKAHLPIESSSSYGITLSSPILLMFIKSVLLGRRLLVKRLTTTPVWSDSYFWQGLMDSHQSPVVSNIGSILLSQCKSDYKLCVEFLNLHGRWLHVREDPPALLRYCFYLLKYTLRTIPTPTLPLSPNDCKLGSVLLFWCVTGYKLCVEFLNLHGRWLHVREDPPALLRYYTYHLRFLLVVSPNALRFESNSVENLEHVFLFSLLLASYLPCISLVENLSKSSYACFARAVYDHLLVEEFEKSAFMFDSALVPKDLSSIASLSKSSTILKNSWNHYLYLLCISLTSICMNSPPFEGLS
ncbi:PREDICTED: uncharacterized protein LOC109129069 [Camelina sativa]|uniref:Uncharacterized protein LOC109129069 n=1 Tax=Camelina sativa TaxID=90675 RepID=A0ABM1QZL4_CAMSA|nr:PREDICTED: uncharacterized protein LOC109129069 [Camelina sativa]